MSSSPERIKGEEVSRLAERLFDKYPFDISQHLADSNVVLTLAGVKGQTKFFIDVPDASQDEELKIGIGRLAKELHSYDPNLVIRVSGEPFAAASDGRRMLMIDLMNLTALEESLAKTKIVEFPAFDTSQGIQGYDAWREEVVEKFGAESDEVEMEVGIRKGYPDQAIVDFIDWYNTGRQRNRMCDSNIPYAGTYKEAEPNYYFYPEHASDPEIVENIRMAGEVLAGFYESPWHTGVAEKLAFRRITMPEEN